MDERVVDNKGGRERGRGKERGRGGGVGGQGKKGEVNNLTMTEAGHIYADSGHTFILEYTWRS